MWGGSHVMRDVGGRVYGWGAPCDVVQDHSTKSNISACNAAPSTETVEDPLAADDVAGSRVRAPSPTWEDSSVLFVNPMLTLGHTCVKNPHFPN